MSQPGIPSATAPRIVSVDLLRGIVMVIMAIDHVRNFFSPFPYPPEDLSQASAGLFLTRWITHFCAPVFIFLAGTSAYLYRHNRSCSHHELARFLVTRGLWLIFIELSVINLSWTFGWYPYLFVQVIWAIGWSMIFLAGMLYLPFWVSMGSALTMIVGHNLLDPIQAQQFGDWSIFWNILHEMGGQPVPIINYFFVAYPLIPWLGVMVAGYGFGRLVTLPADHRNPLLYKLGLGLVAAFIILRGFNLYGDPEPWQPSERGLLFSVLEILNTEKYPPSLAYLLMTLSPAIALLPLIEKWRGRLADGVKIFGQVPFFYYLVHLLLIHILAMLWIRWTFGTWDRLRYLSQSGGFPESYEPSLLRVYLVWIMVVGALYPLCRWYAHLKKRSQSWWLSYL
ncbi:conserved hypothetical protein [Nitrosococcus halophilus Nc 4]|uniref:Heparan-alpha-glucosaminide N-acetyltransferase catalytic domain-containing protein n=1 Tax=Nitrosococcus halophilus (strain Nc4) TaxID=472759 RepID=D5C443_NITHN|nr:heparan-alpha-glucosaminide N-acetyltransferase domain-containing protein [Nitrosococcus halophilus]ADE13231.1 conserved hypothetical protein [Nitrosococcus halophilus Nc 4]